MKLGNLPSYKILNIQASNYFFAPYLRNILEPPYLNLQGFNYATLRRYLPKNSLYFTH